MTKYELYNDPPVYKQIDKVHARYRQRIRKMINSLVIDPYPNRWDFKALSNECEGLDIYQIKLGLYRIVYHVDERYNEITIKKVGIKRGPEFYEGLC